MLGKPKSYHEANLILDDLVREAFLFLKDNPTHVAQFQPYNLYKIINEYDKELTDALIKAELISDGYGAVLSGTDTKAGDAFDGGNYRLVVYTIKGKRSWEQQGDINVNLYIQLKKGTETGIQNAVGEYNVDKPMYVVFEEANNKREGWSDTPRQISISKKVLAQPLPPSTDDHDDVLAFEKGKTPLNNKGIPIPESLFPNARKKFSTHPAGTRYEAGPYDISCYFPKESK